MEYLPKHISCQEPVANKSSARICEIIPASDGMRTEPTKCRPKARVPTLPDYSAGTCQHTEDRGQIYGALEAPFVFGRFYHRLYKYAELSPFQFPSYRAKAGPCSISPKASDIRWTIAE